MYHSQFPLLAARRFLPLFVAQFLGAFNDNLFKNALVILITYAVAQQSGLNAQLLVTAAAGVFILPFFLFSATAGQLADKYDKARLIRWIKFAEIGLMALAGIGFVIGSVALLMTVLFLMGTQSAFFGPLKYGILPDQLAQDELISGNALIEAGTFLAILLGTIAGGLLILTDGGLGIVSGLVLVVAGAGWLASLVIPPGRAAAPELAVGWNVASETWRIMRHAAGNRPIFLSILGISWFWLVGATFLAQFPTLAKDVIGANEQVVTLFLTVFSVGIAIGSLLCNRLLKGQVHATFVPLGAVGITVFTIDLVFATGADLAAGPGGLIGVGTFLGQLAGWRIAIDLLLIAVSGGLFIVPLYAILQHRSDPAHRARNIAGNNVMNALFMVVAALATAAMLQAGFTVPEVFLVMAALNGAVAVYITRLLPGALVKAFIAWLLQTLYRVEVHGLEHYHRAGDRVVLVANHQSYLDAALVAAFVPDTLTFAINTTIAKHRFVKFFLALARTFPMDPTNALSLRGLVDCVERGEKVVIFPEGRITVTGSLMKVYEGPGVVAEKAGAQILPIRLEGAQYTPFSHLRGKVRLRLFPKIVVRFMAPRRFAVPAGLSARQRRALIGRQLYDLMTTMIFESSDYRRNLFWSLLDARHTHGAGHVVLEDVDRKPMTYGELLRASLVLGRALARASLPGEHVGLLLPNMRATVVALLGLLARGRVAAMLNFSTGSRNVALACQSAGIRTVYSSRRFVELAGLAAMIEAVEGAGVRVVYLEDLRAALRLRDKLVGLLGSLAPGLYHRLIDRRPDPDQAAVILFTSGTEGAPKGVVLSHTNIQANRFQVAARVDFGPADVVFNTLPLFHSFGLTCGTLLPLLSGLRTFLYPSPLHYRIVPELAYDANATILFGTDTFLAGYGKHAHPYDFYSVRYAFAGAERLKPETRRLWAERFGVRIFEGYGATETAPVLSMNTPMQYRPGTVGRLLPGIEHRLEPVSGVEVGGRLLVAGPNVMVGYLRAEAPGVVEPAPEGWYDTGDIVSLDAEGYITIHGRVKRFAKIGGEMISLAAVEAYVERLWPGHVHTVVSLPDATKGEQLVLVTDHPAAEREALVAFARSEGVAEIAIPKSLRRVERVPLLGSGKVDYVAVKALVDAGGGVEGKDVEAA